MENKQYVYIAVNLVINEKLIKVGMTLDHPDGRIKQLNRATGVVEKWELYDFLEVDDCKVAEYVSHYNIKPFIDENNKEQFWIYPELALNILKECLEPYRYDSEERIEQARKIILRAKATEILGMQNEAGFAE